MQENSDKEVIKEKAYGCIPVCPQKGGQFLLVQNTTHDGDPGHWSFPKGHPEDFEHKTETALRELEEETGLLPDELVQDMVFKETYTYDHPDEHRVKKKNSFFIAFFVNKLEPVTSEEEIHTARWVTYDEALDLLTFESAEGLLREAYLQLNMNDFL